jgi:hypothetical protein
MGAEIEEVREVELVGVESDDCADAQQKDSNEYRKDCALALNVYF